MLKGYWIAHITVDNPKAYHAYAAGATEAFRLYGGRPLARGGRTVLLEGAIRPRNVVIEFESLEAALRCYGSPEYQAAMEHRVGIATGEVMIVEGVM